LDLNAEIALATLWIVQLLIAPGTHVAGTIGASGNNSIGITGINWNSGILPVRVLGKCGGYASDLADSMLWAAGIAVDGVPTNAHPARVLNMSLSGAGSCLRSIQSAVNQVSSVGAVIVVSAGNSSTDANGFYPANCDGVITTAATDINGERASYSNYGLNVMISAPGGTMSYTNDPNGILSTFNTGLSVPAIDSYAYYQGTSMAVPHVSGVISLMLSVNPDLTPRQIHALLQTTARSFPSGSTCTISDCGAGILDAEAAVTAASNPFQDFRCRVAGPY
jgi:serine protease